MGGVVVQSGQVTVMPNGCPVPVRATVAGLLAASLAIASVAGPPSTPMVGANVTVTPTLVPAASIAGTPVIVYPTLFGVMVAGEMVTVASPLFDKVSGNDFVLPSSNVPNASVLGVATSSGPVPVQVRLTT